MPVEEGAAIEKAREIWWLLSNPLLWALWLLSFWHASRYQKEMEREDLKEWQKLNPPPS